MADNINPIKLKIAFIKLEKKCLKLKNFKKYHNLVYKVGIDAVPVTPKIEVTNVNDHYRVGEILYSDGCYASFYKVTTVTPKSVVVQLIGKKLHTKGHASSLIVPDDTNIGPDKKRYMISSIRPTYIKMYGWMSLNKWDGTPVEYYQD